MIASLINSRGACRGNHGSGSNLVPICFQSGSQSASTSSVRRPVIQLDIEGEVSK
jgi:hypothetical protein